MKKVFTIIIGVSLAFAFLFSCSETKNTSTNAKTSIITGQSELYTTIARMDSMLFAAFNNRDTTLFKTLFTNDLEFYHDKGGLTNYTHSIEFLKTTKASGSDLKRELMPGSLEVYPVKDYGAIQIGQHRFCHTENGKPDCGVFKFVHVWKKENDNWKISRIISYDH